MADWSFLTNHARVLLCIAHDPGVRLRDIAARTGVTERTAYGIVTDLTGAGYVVKHKDGTRGDETITVTGMGRSQDFEHVSVITAYGGSGNDTIIVKEGVLSDAYPDGVLKVSVAF